MSDETKRDILDELVDAIAATDLEGDMLASATFADAHFEIATLRARVEELEGETERLGELRNTLREHYDHFHEGIENKCPDCFGYGKRTYASTATWRGGIGGQALTVGVCDRCWGSGDGDRAWPSHRRLEALAPAAPSDEENG